MPSTPAASGIRPLVYTEASLSAAKWLAVILMIVDHWNKYLYEGTVLAMYAAGRVAMPLFMFVVGYNLARPGQLASGTYRRMSVRIAVAGLLATPAFVTMNKLGLGWWPLNIMFALLVVVGCAWLFELRRAAATIAGCLLLVWGGALVEFWWPGVGLGLCVWAYQRKPSVALIASFLVCLLALWFVNGNLWQFAVIPVLFALRLWPVVLPRLKWLFYAFYPLHLTAFLLVLAWKK